MVTLEKITTHERTYRFDGNGMTIFRRAVRYRILKDGREVDSALTLRRARFLLKQYA